METLLYYDPMALVYGNRQLDAAAVRQAAILPLLKRNSPTKSFDKVKVWKINMMDTVSGRAHDLLLSVHDLDEYFESDIA